MRGCDNGQGLITVDGGGGSGVERGVRGRVSARGEWWRVVAQLPDKILRQSPTITIPWYTWINTHLSFPLVLISSVIYLKYCWANRSRACLSSPNENNMGRLTARIPKLIPSPLYNCQANYFLSVESWGRVDFQVCYHRLDILSSLGTLTLSLGTNY